MATIGTRIDEIGTLLSEGAAFVLRRDLGGRWILDLHRVPIDMSKSACGSLARSLATVWWMSIALSGKPEFMNTAKLFYFIMVPGP